MDGKIGFENWKGCQKGKEGTVGWLKVFGTDEFMGGVDHSNGGISAGRNILRA